MLGLDNTQQGPIFVCFCNTQQVLQVRFNAIAPKLAIRGCQPEATRAQQEREGIRDLLAPQYGHSETGEVHGGNETVKM